MENNLFTYAYKELSQDAFICWLMSYAKVNAEEDKALGNVLLVLLECLFLNYQRMKVQKYLLLP